jgi:hypothetical protein
MVFVEVNQNFRIRARREPMTAADEALLQLLEVVDLAVHDDGDRSVLVEDRLVTAGYVDDRQPLDAEADTVLDEDTARVRPSVLHNGAHPMQQLGVDRSLEVHLADDSAHA